MSAAPRYPRNTDLSGLRMTADEYLAVGETDERYELIDGVVVMSPSPGRRHQKVYRLILRQIEAHIDRDPSVDVFPDTDVRLSDSLVYRPDLALYRVDRLPPDDQPIDVPPNLAIEVLSPGNRQRDLVTKRDDYERFAVPEYWIVDPLDGRTRCWRRQGPRLIEIPVEGDTLPSSAIDGFVLDLRPLRRASDPD